MPDSCTLAPMDKYGIALESSGTLTLDHEVDKTGSGLTIDCVIIEGDRWGSSGYYPASVLERDAAKFVEGTQIHLDHTESGKTDSAGTLMGTLTEAARYVEEDDGKKVLRAPLHFYATGTHNADWVRERMRSLGLSIRAGVTFASGTREGRSGKIVTSFTEAFSVDVVARAGAGGKFGMIKESAHPALAVEATQKGNTVEKEERDAIAAAVAVAVAEAMKPAIDGLTTAVSEVKIATENAGKGTPPTAREVAQKLSASKLGEKATERVWTAFEADASSAEAAISVEIERRDEAVAEAKKNQGHIEFNEDGTPKSGTAEEAAMPKGWGVEEVKG